MMNARAVACVLVALVSIMPSHGLATFQPYILGSKSSSLSIESLEGKLRNAGFDILGKFSPAKDYETVAFTHPDLKKEASKAPVPIGAVLRASLVKNNGMTELSYCSPHYWAYATGLPGASSDALMKKLEDALGNEGGFGSAKGLTEANLRNFQYAFAMPKVGDLDKLGKFDSFKEATEAVNRGIEASPKVRQVYSLVIDESTQVFGVSVLDSKGSESTVLGVTDAASKTKLGGLYGPYEIFIKGGDVMATRGRFRIAVAFPDLSMGTFMKIVSAPGAILDSLKSTTQVCSSTK